MPWINKELCTGCGICVAECPADSIEMQSDGAVIDEESCIRCGICHNVCPTDASRHDGERIPAEVKAKLDWAKDLMEHKYYMDNPELQAGLKERLRRHFTKNRKVMEQAIEHLDDL